MVTGKTAWKPNPVYNAWHYNLGQGSHERPYTIVNVLLFFFLNVGCENGSTQLKKLFLNNIWRKEEKNQREVTLVKCHKLYSGCVPLFLRPETESFYVLLFSCLLQKRLLYFINPLDWQQRKTLWDIHLTLLSPSLVQLFWTLSGLQTILLKKIDYNILKTFIEKS